MSREQARKILGIVYIVIAAITTMLCFQVSDMNEKLKSLNTKMANTEAHLDQIERVVNGR